MDVIHQLLSRTSKHKSLVVTFIAIAPFGRQFVSTVADITRLFRILFPEFLTAEVDGLDFPS